MPQTSDQDDEIVDVIAKDLLHAEYHGAKPHERWMVKSAAWRIVRNLQASGHVITKQAQLAAGGESTFHKDARVN
jgi:hypothetical protein